MNNPSTTNDETEQLYQILSLLEVTYSSNDTSQIKAGQEQLQNFSKNLPLFTNLLYKSLFLNTIKDIQYL